MSLLVQFLIVSILPLSLVGMAIYVWRQGPVSRRVGVWWTLSLLASAIWASSLLSAYLGIDVSVVVGYNWRIIGRYSLTLTGTLNLITALAFIWQAKPTLGRLPWLGFGLWLLAMALDPTIVPYSLPDVPLGGLVMRHFDWWAAVWVLSWAVPMATAWFYIERVTHHLPSSLYRNQINFWFLTTSLFLVGGGLALVRDRIGAQQVGAIILILASFIGTASITRTYLPDIQNLLRQFFFAAARSLLLFVTIWGGLVLLTRYMVSTANQTSLVVLASAVLTVAIFLFLSLTDALFRSLVMPAQAQAALALEQRLDLGSNLLPPTEMADLFVGWLQSHIPHEGSWVMTTADGPQGILLLQPCSSNSPKEAMSLTADSPLAAYFRQNNTPLTQQDIDSLTLFSRLNPAERAAVNNLARTLFMPVHASGRLVALVGLPAKTGDEPYSREEFHLLAEQAAKFGPLLVQAQALTVVQETNLHVFRQNRQLAQENRRLTELVALHRQFTALMAPGLRRPFNDLELQLVKLHGQPEAPASNGPFAQVQHSATEARAMVDNLITVAGRLEKQTKFELAPVFMDAVIRSASKSLLAMAEARRNKIEFEVRGKLLPVLGDEQRLVEAMQQLLHNSLKYNKLNHYVQIICEMRGNEVRIQVVDFGVGIPPNRLDDIWQGLTKLEGESNDKRRRTRLGLALTRFIIQSHGGRIEVRSTYGSGSTFTIHLPALLDEE